MTDNPNEVTVDNSVLIFIDHQPWVAFAVNSIDPSLLSNNLEGLASSAKALDVPVILTTVGAEGGKLRDPLMRAVADVFPDKIPIDRTSTNAWADIREAVEATGRKTLLMAGLWTEVCLAQTAISALADGYRVFFVSDCSGGPGGHEERCRRWARPGTGFRPDLDRRGGLRRTRTQEETDGETDRPREQVLRCVGQRPWRRRSSRVLHRRRRVPQHSVRADQRQREHCRQHRVVHPSRPARHRAH